MKSNKIIWRGKEIGVITNLSSDMSFLEGKWKANESKMAKEFDLLVKTLNAKEVYKKPESGTRIELYEKNTTQPIHALVLTLDGELLCMKMIFQEKSIQWLLENVN